MKRWETQIQNAAISPTGVRAVFEARGEILTVPAEKGDVRNLTRTTAVAERDPAWSPDGKSIAFFSDESGEYALHIVDQTGLGTVKKINLGKSSLVFLCTHMVSRQQENRLHGQATESLVCGRGKRHACKGDCGSVRRSFLHDDRNMVTGQQVADLCQVSRKPHAKHLCLFPGNRKGIANHGRHQ